MPSVKVNCNGAPSTYIDIDGQWASALGGSGSLTFKDIPGGDHRATAQDGNSSNWVDFSVGDSDVEITVNV